jgi:hypothetical protein
VAENGGGGEYRRSKSSKMKTQRGGPRPARTDRGQRPWRSITGREAEAHGLELDCGLGPNATSVHGPPSPRLLLLRPRGDGAGCLPRRRRGRRSARASPGKGLRPSSRPERGVGFLQIERPPVAFSDLKVEARQRGCRRSASSRLKSLIECRRPGRPVPARSGMWRRREAKRTRTDAHDG